MSFENFDLLEARLNQLVQNEKYQEALDLVTQEGKNFPQDRIWVDFWRMYTAASLGDFQLVFQVAEQSLADGFWYSAVMWQRLPSFEAIQLDPSYERIMSASRAAAEKDDQHAKSILLTRLPENHSSTSPLLLAFHGNQSTAAQTLPFWQKVISEGWVLALPQSTQILYKGASYSWDDFEIARAEINEHFSHFQQHTAFNPNCAVLAGHSMGGLVAIRMALLGEPMARGFVVIGPAVPFLDEPEELDELLIPAAQRGIRGYFILGAEDNSIYKDGIYSLKDKLLSSGVSCELETIPGAGHSYTSAYDEALLRGLAFIAKPN